MGSALQEWGFLLDENLTKTQDTLTYDGKAPGDLPRTAAKETLSSGWVTPPVSNQGKDQVRVRQSVRSYNGLGLQSYNGLCNASFIGRGTFLDTLTNPGLVLSLIWTQRGVGAG